MNLHEIRIKIRHLRNRSRHIKHLAETLERAQRNLWEAESEIYRNTEHRDALIRLLIEIRECCRNCPNRRNIEVGTDRHGAVKVSRLEDDIDSFLRYELNCDLSGNKNADDAYCQCKKTDNKS